LSKNIAPPINLTSDQLSHLNCDKTEFYGLNDSTYDTPKIPFNATGQTAWLALYCQQQHESIMKAAVMMSIPYYINVGSSTFLGIAIDRFGKCAYLLAITPAMFVVAHLLLGLTNMPPLLPLLLQGVAYSVYSAALWAPIAYIIEERYSITTVK
jgi:MFS family permease